jgi:hypothetical protein
MRLITINGDPHDLQDTHVPGAGPLTPESRSGSPSRRCGIRHLSTKLPPPWEAWSGL